MAEGSKRSTLFPVESYNNSAARIGNAFVFIPSLFSAIGVVEKMSVLDIGCGFGRYCKPLIDAGASSYVGVDVSQEMIDKAQKEHEKMEKASFLRMDAKDITFDDQFDLVIANYLLQFCDSTENLMNVCKNIYRSLRKGRRAIGFVPNGIRDLSFTEEEGRKFG